MIGYTFLVLTVLISTVQSSPGWWIFGNSKANDRIEDRVDFYLYTQKSLGTPVKTKITDWTLFGGKINVAKPVKILIHGYLSNKDKFFAKTIREAYLNKGDINVINVDWSQDARSMYPTAKNHVPAVGKVVAKFIDRLVAETGLKAEQIHVLGHSLGAHVAGVAGLNIKSGRLMRITGLDPAGPLFSYKNEERLKPSSASFVDVIHTCGKGLGFHGDLGLVDFYPNHGTAGQPGCSITLGKCSHRRAIELYAESLKNPKGFLSRKCDQWKHFKAKKCESNPTTFMGEYVGYEVLFAYFEVGDITLSSNLLPEDLLPPYLASLIAWLNPKNPKGTPWNNSIAFITYAAYDGIVDRTDLQLYTHKTLDAPVITRITDRKLFGGKINQF